MTSPDRYINRDLSWLEFNRRVLAQATDVRTPLLERVKFLAIFSSNLDEFFMKRVGLLRRRMMGGAAATSRPNERMPTEILAEIRKVVLDLQEIQGNCWEQDVMPALAREGIEICGYDQLEQPERERADDWHRRNVFPVLTPLAVDPGHRFPFISNLSENLGVLLGAGSNAEPLFGRVKVPGVLPKFVRVDGGNGTPTPAEPARFVRLDELIVHNLDELFPGHEIDAVTPFRVTRNAALELEDDDEIDDLLEQVRAEIRLRRFAGALRIQVNPDPDPRVLQFVTEELELGEKDIYARPGPLGYADLMELTGFDRPDLKDAPWRPVTPPVLTDADPDQPGAIFDAIRRRDILVHHPYESFEDSVEQFVASAAADPDVLAIKQTLYRTSRDSPFVASLVAAAEEGKQVACLVELRARFDEEKNVRFARQLEKAGVHVAYGVVGLKTHCKCSLVVRRETLEDGSVGIRTYAHVGTGNYHPGTAQLYTDLGLLTCDPDLTGDVVRLFNALTGHAARQDYARLVVAPAHMRARFSELIDHEIELAKAGKPARIIAKMNSLEDRKLTDRLYAASEAGVRVTLFVRGFCCLRPGVKGLSENIEAFSVIGRFLEHSRIFYFGSGHEDPLRGTYYIGSADWMYRNLNNRVEAMSPVNDPAARERLWAIFEIMRRDRRNAWTINGDGSSTLRTLPADVKQFAKHDPERAGTFGSLMARTLAGHTPTAG